MESFEKEMDVYLEEEGVRHPVGPVYWVKGENQSLDLELGGGDADIREAWTRSWGIGIWRDKGEKQ